MTPETLIHAGTEHPNLLWVLGPALLSFAAGVVVGARQLHRRLLPSEISS